MSQKKIYLVVIICHTRETNFQRPPLAKFGCGARSFTGDPDCCCVGRAWHSRGRRGSAGAREQPVFTKQAAVKIKCDIIIITLLVYYIIMLNTPRCRIVIHHRRSFAARTSYIRAKHRPGHVGMGAIVKAIMEPKQARTPRDTCAPRLCATAHLLYAQRVPVQYRWCF